MAQFAFYFDQGKCTGCKTCQVSCKETYKLPVNNLYRKVLNYQGGTWEPNEATGGYVPNGVFGYFASMACNHCVDPACVANCPTGAMRKDEETGLVNSDPAVCIGCGTCRSACPYDAPRIDADSNVSRKCDGCLARVREDEEPMCVGACPLRALEFGPIEELREKHGDLAQIPPMPEPSTSPNIVIGSCQAIDSDAYDVGEGYVANPLEVE